MTRTKQTESKADSKPEEPKSADDEMVAADSSGSVTRGEADGAVDGDCADEVVDDADAAEPDADVTNEASAKRRIAWPAVKLPRVSPLLAWAGLALLLAVAAGFLKWQDASSRSAQIAGVESVAAAKDSTIALLSYKAGSVEKELDAARSRLTGTFQQSYTQLIHDVVIPGAKQKNISSVATVPAAALVSATANHAVALLYVDQSVVIGTDAPTDSTSSVKVTLDKVGGRWLISDFSPV